MSKQCYATDSPFEDLIGYYRAVRHGQHIFVSGTTSVDPTTSIPQILFPGDAKQQTRVALQECIKAVKAMGGRGPEDIVRVKMFVSRREDCRAVGEGFKEILGKENASSSDTPIGAAATMIVVHNGFIDPDMLVEIEVDAIAVD
ncbi:YjgH family protein [Aspergillus brunneoviolaceus CBS 621.78]|uniref:L-PSP family endoribonuclease n=2 Tax=Aspergillus TaxID=5052 RepID=A0ACD1GQ78_9EURO|nr:putative L-PSP family endoribonuclease [Aspergillus brunneoviolaceus CBS 621.78]XP_040806592.1 putative L-PSP family endoribonuclease [Aspergillus fijiensis CBS 313.89]RAH51524.1 putative L-PSP family endoribonuclease [Aspergillus brunneoviolaceus CBS 621.78]RAK82582.1 putative L-PSP family endoribonuclease [Aspergillus fijiensis CBS 313.89]